MKASKISRVAGYDPQVGRGNRPFVIRPAATRQPQSMKRPPVRTARMAVRMKTARIRWRRDAPTAGSGELMISMAIRFPPSNSRETGFQRLLARLDRGDARPAAPVPLHPLVPVRVGFLGPCTTLLDFHGVEIDRAGLAPCSIAGRAGAGSRAEAPRSLPIVLDANHPSPDR